MKSKAGGILSWLLAFAVIVAMMPSMAFADTQSSSFNATCSVLYDIHGEVDLTGIKVETDSNVSATQYGIEIDSTKHNYTSPFKGGCYVVDISGLSAGTTYQAKPYYIDNGQTVYADSFSFTTTARLQTQYWQVSNFQYDVMRTYNKTATSSVGFSIKKGTRKADQNNYRMDLCGISNGQCLTTSFCCLGSQLFIGDTSSQKELTHNEQVKLTRYDNRIDVWQVPEISEDGKFVTITYYVRNISDSDISNLNLGSYTKLMVGDSFEDDRRTLSKTTVSKTAYGLKVERRGTAYALALNDGYTDTPIDTSYVGGNHGAGGKNVFQNSTVSSYIQSSYFDAWPCLAYSWNLRTIKPGEMKSFTVTATVESSSTIDNTVKTALADTVLTAGASTTVKTKKGNVTVANTGNDGAVTVKKNGTVIVPAGSIATINGIEYKAAAGGAKFKIDKQTGEVTLTEGSISLTKGGPAAIGNRVIKSTGDEVVINNEGITLYPGGQATVDDVTYKNGGVSDNDVTVVFNADNKTNTVTLPAYATATVGSKTYTAGKNGAVITADENGKSQVTDGNIWLDGDAGIEIGGIEIINNWNDTIAVYSSKVTIPANASVSIGGREISGTDDIQVTVDGADGNKKASINIPGNGSIEIDGKTVENNSGTEVNISIDKDGKVETTIPAGKSITVDGKTIGGDESRTTDVEINKDGVTADVPANGSVTIDGKTYRNGSKTDKAEIKATIKDGVSCKLLSGTVSLDKNETIKVGEGDTLVKNTGDKVISVTAHDSGAYVSVPNDGKFKAGDNTGENTSKKTGTNPINFEIDASSDLYISKADDDQTAKVNGQVWKWLELSGAAAGTAKEYTTSIEIPKKADGSPFALYSIYFTGTSFTVPVSSSEGTFSNGVNGATNVGTISSTTPLTSVQFTTESDATVENVQELLSQIKYRGNGTVTITATKDRPKTNEQTNLTDVYYNGHYYRLYNAGMVHWDVAMSRGGDTTTYPGYKGHPITATTVGENNMLITLRDLCAGDTTGKRIWLGAVPKIATVTQQDSGYNTYGSIPNAGATAGNAGDGSNWKWIWGTPEGDRQNQTKNTLPSDSGDGKGYWGATQPDGGRDGDASVSYVIYIGHGGPVWDDLNKGSLGGVYKDAYYVIEYSPYDSTSGSWIYDSDGNSATSGFSSVQSVSETYNADNIGKISVGKSMVGFSGKTIANTSAKETGIVISVESEDGVDTVTIPKAGGKVTIDGTEYVAEADDTVLTVTEDGVTTLAKSKVTLAKGKTIQVGSGETVENTGDGAVKIERTENVGGFTATIPAGGEISIVKGDKTTVIRGDADKETTVVVDSDGKITATVPDGGSVDIDGKVYKDGGDKSDTGNEIKVELDRNTNITDLTVPTAGDKVTIGDIEYETSGSNTSIKVSGASLELTSGGVKLDANETIKVSKDDKIVEVENTGDEIIAVAKASDGGFTANVPVDGSISVGGSAFENDGNADANIGVGTDGTLTIPAAAGGKVSGNIIIKDKTSGTKVDIPAGKTYYVEDETISEYTAGDRITINGVTRELTGDSFLLADSNTLKQGEELTVEDGSTDDTEISLVDGKTTASVTVKAYSGKTTVAWNEVTIGNNGGKVVIGGKTYTAGTDGATFTFNDNRTDLILTDGSAEMDNVESLTARIGDNDITVSTNSDTAVTGAKTVVEVDKKTETGTVTTDGNGEVTIGGTVYTTGTGGATFTIDKDGAVKVTGGSASVKGSSATDVSVGDKTITITGANDVTAGNDGSVIVTGTPNQEIVIGENTYTAGDGGATFTIGSDGKETLTGGSAVINADNKINVGQGKATVENKSNGSITVSMGENGSGELTVPAGGEVKISGVIVGGATVTESDSESDEKTDKNVVTDVTIGADGTATMTVPENGSITVGDKTVSGPSGTTVKVGTDGKITVVAPGESDGNVNITVKENNTEKVYSVKGNTRIDITDTGGSITGQGSSVTLDENKEITVNGTTVKNETTGEGKAVEVDVNGDGSTVTVPAGGTVSIGGKEIKGAAGSPTTITINEEGKATVTIPNDGSVTVDGKTVSGPVGTNVEIDSEGNVAVVAPASATAGEIKVQPGADASDTETTYTIVPTDSNGDAVVGQTNAVATRIELTENGNKLVQGGVKLGSGQTIIGGSGQTVTGTGDGVTVRTSILSGEDTVTVSSGSGVTVEKVVGKDASGEDIVEKTVCNAAGDREATLAVYRSDSVQLTGGSVSLTEGEIYDGYKTITKTEGAVTVGLTTDELGNRTGATATIPAGSSATVGGKTIRPETGGTSVETDGYGETIINMNSNGKVAIGSGDAAPVYEATSEETRIKINGSTNELVEGGVKLSDNAEIIANGTKVKGVSGGTTVSVTTTEGETGESPTAATVTIPNGGSAEIGGKVIEVAANASVEIAGNGKATMQIPSDGSIKVGGKVISGTGDPSSVIISSDGEVQVSIPQGSSVTVDGETISGSASGTGDTVIKIDGNKADKSGNEKTLVDGSAELGNCDYVTGNSGKTIKNTGDSEVSIAKDESDQTDIVTVKGNGNVAIGGTEYTVKNSGDVNTLIKVSADGAELTSGSIELDKQEEIKVGGTAVRGIEGTATVNGDNGTVTIPAGGSASVSGTTIKAGAETVVTVDDNGSVTLNVPESGVTVGGKKITGDGATVTIDKDGNATVTIPSSGLITVGGKEISGGAGKTVEINLAGSDEAGTPKALDNDGSATLEGNDYVTGNSGKTIKNTGDSKISIAKDSNLTDTDIVTVTENGSITIGDTEYTVKNSNNVNTFIKVSADGAELTGGSVELDKEENINVGGVTVRSESGTVTAAVSDTSKTVTIPAGGSASVNGKTIKAGGETTVTVDDNGSVTLNVPDSGVTIGGKKITGAGATVTIDKDGKAAVTIPEGVNVTVGGNSVSGDADTTVEIDLTESDETGAPETLDNNGSATLEGNDYVTGNSGKTIKNTGDSEVSITKDNDQTNADVVTVKGNGSITIGGTEYTVKNSGNVNTLIKVSDDGIELTGGSVELDKGENINVGVVTVRSESGTVTATVNGDNGTVTIPAGGSASVSGTTIKAGAETTVTVDDNGSVTLNVPESGVTIGGKKITGAGATVTIDKDGNATVTIPEGVGVTVGGKEISGNGASVIISSDGEVQVSIPQGSSVIVDGKAISNTGTEETVIKIDGDKTDKSGNEKTLENGNAELGNSDYATGNSGKTIKNTGDSEVSIAKDSNLTDTDIVTVTGNGNVAIGNTEYTVKNSNNVNTFIKVSADGAELTGGSVELDKEENINVGGVTVRSESGTVTAAVSDTSKTVTIPAGGSASVNGKTIKAGGETTVTVGNDESVTLNVPDSGVTIGGKKITGAGATVTIDKDGNVSIKTNSEEVEIDGVKQAAGSDGVINLGGTADSDDDERNSLVSGIVSLNANKAVTGNSGETIRNLGSGNVTVGSGTDNDIITMGSGAKVKIGDGTYTAGSDDATLVADKAGVEITKGSVTISNGNGEVEIKGVTVGGKSGTVTVSATNNGSSVTGGTVTISDGGSAVIAGKTVTGNDGGTAISIDTDGKAILNVASDKSATVNGATLTGTGDGGSAFTLGTDGITVPAGAAVTASDGKTAIVSVAKDTKVEVGTDGGLTLVEGKGTVKGAEENDSSISVKIDGETVNVTVPAGKSYTIDADKGTLGTLAKDETVIIGGVTYTAGSENAGFSIKDVSLNTGDKAEIPANTNADIKLGSGDNAPEATVPGGNTGKVTITKDTDDNGAEVTTITIEAENDSFIINGKTYTAESDKATYTVSKNGAVTLTSGKTSVSGNKQIKLNNSSYTAGDNGATVEVVEVGDNTAGKVTAGSVKVDKDQKIAVGNDETNTIIENKETGKIEVGSDGSVTVPANGEVSVGGNVYNIGDEETVLKVGNDGTVSVEQGTVTIPAGAAVKDENSAATITDIEGGTGTKVKVIDNRLVITEGKAEVTGNSENGSRVSVKVGNKVVDVIVPQGKTYTIDTVNSTVSGLAADETVTIDGVTYTSVDGNNSFPLINGALTGNGASAAVPAGTSKTVKVGNVDVKVSSNNSGDTKVAKTDDGAQIELGKSGDKITVGGNVYEAESDGTKLDVDSDGKVTLKEGKITAPANAEIKVGDTTVSGSGNITVETKTEKTGTETETKKETVTVQKENSTVSIGNKTYTVSEKNTEIEITAAGNRLLAGGVSLDNDAEIIFGEKTVYSGSNVTLTVNTDGTAAAAVPNSGKITIGGKEYEAGSSGATLIVDREGNILIEEGTLKVSANSNITVGGNTYTAAAGGQGIEIKGRGKDQTPAIVLAQDSIAEVKLSDGRTATYTAANADTQFALAGNGSDVKNIELLDNGDSNANSALNFTDKDSYKINGVTYTAGNTGGYTVTYGKDNENNCNKIDAAAGSDVTAVMDKDTKIKIGSVKNGNITLTGDITFTADNSKAAIVITKTGDTNTVSGSGSYLTEIKDNDGNITGYKVTKYYSGGGSVVAPVTPSETDTITADVTGDKTSVKITAKISEESATVAEIDKTDLDKAGTGADITIDLSVLPKEITSATVTKKSLENVCDSEAEKVSIKLTEATVNMDRGTLENIIDQMKGQDLKLVVDKHEEAIESMNEAQKNTVTEMNSPKLMDAYFISGGTRITDFRGGSVDIEVPYPDKKGVKAWYIDDNGNKEEVPVKYDGKTAVITVSHFSYYVLEEYTPDNAEPVTADTLNKVIYVKSIKYTKKTGTKITFNKVPGADGYYIYGNKCNTDKVYKFKKLATLKGNDNTVFVHKKTAKNTFYKYYIRAYKIVDGKKVTLSTSKEIHFVTDVKGYSYGNPTKIKLSVSKRTISKGKTFNLKNRVKVYSSKKVLLHTAKVRYVSSDSSIAKVNSSGKITAKKTGRCYVYAIAQNGIAARIAVTVK